MFLWMIFFRKRKLNMALESRDNETNEKGASGFSNFPLNM